MATNSTIPPSCASPSVKTSSSSSSSSSNNSMSTGVLSAIVAGGVIGLALLIFVALIFNKNRYNHKIPAQAEAIQVNRSAAAGADSIEMAGIYVEPNDGFTTVIQPDVVIASSSFVGNDKLPRPVSPSPAGRRNSPMRGSSPTRLSVENSMIGGGSNSRQNSPVRDRSRSPNPRTHMM